MNEGHFPHIIFFPVNYSPLLFKFIHLPAHKNKPDHFSCRSDGILFQISCKYYTNNQKSGYARLL